MRRSLELKILDSLPVAGFRKLRSRIANGKLKKLIFDCKDIVSLTQRNLERLQILVRKCNDNRARIILDNVQPELLAILELTRTEPEVRLSWPEKKLGPADAAFTLTVQL